MWNLVIREAYDKKGLYYYFLPTYAQGKKVIWEAITIDGVEFLAFIPPELIESKNSQEMKIKLVNGSIIRVIGTDNFDSIRGTNPRGCVFSEYAYQDPMVWEVISPILKANKGWAIFNTTPNGKNHAYKMHKMAKDNPRWHTEVLTVNDTDVLTLEDIEEERAEGKEEAMIQQEYYCSYDVGMLGAYYAPYVAEAHTKNHVCSLPYQQLLKVHVAFDLGRNDKTVLIFFQLIGKEIHIIDYYENNGKGVEHYVGILRAKGYVYEKLWLPHDGFARRMESDQTIAEQFGAAFPEKIGRVPEISLLNGINLVRKIFPKLWFDKVSCERLLEALESYRKEYDEQKKEYRPTPVHDWASHPCDAVRYLAVVTELVPGLSINDYREAHSNFLRNTEHRQDTVQPRIELLDDAMDAYRRKHAQYLQKMSNS